MAEKKSARPSGLNIRNTKNHRKDENRMSIRIDKSRFDADQLAQYEALIAKAKVDPEAGDDEEDFVPPVPKKKPVEKDDEPVGKSFEEAEARIAALEKSATERIEALEKAAEMRELTEIAKGYAILGEKEDELAATLYQMRKSGGDFYDRYIALLDKNKELMEKSGKFAEIGKSGGVGGNDFESRVEAKAAEIRKSNPGMEYHMSIAKAYEESPELMAEYDESY